MSEPAWVALGAQPVDYAGAWAADTQYAPGDVVRYNGIDYLAVNPSLGVTPPAAAPGSPELGFAERTTPVAIAAAARVTILTTPVIVLAASTALVIEWLVPWLQTTGTATGFLNLLEDAVDLGDIHRADAVSGQSAFVGSAGRLRRVVAAGSHTYTLQGRTTAGTMTAQAGAGGVGVWTPIQLRVVRA